MRPTIPQGLYDAGVVPRAALVGGVGTCINGEAVIKVDLPREYSRPWRLSVDVTGPNAAFGKDELPLAWNPANPYANTSRARILIGSVGQPPVAIDCPAQSGAFYITSHQLQIGIIDPGPPSPGAVASYRLWLDEADSAPNPRELPTYTDRISDALGFGSEVFGIVPRRAVMVQVQPNCYQTSPIPDPPDPVQPTYLLRFYDGSSDLLASYYCQGGGAPPPGRSIWDVSQPCPVPVGAVGYKLRNHAFAGVFEPAVMQFRINL